MAKSLSFSKYTSAFEIMNENKNLITILPEKWINTVKKSVYAFYDSSSTKWFFLAGFISKLKPSKYPYLNNQNIDKAVPKNERGNFGVNTVQTCRQACACYSIKRATFPFVSQMLFLISHTIKKEICIF